MDEQQNEENAYRYNRAPHVPSQVAGRQAPPSRTQAPAGAYSSYPAFDYYQYHGSGSSTPTASYSPAFASYSLSGSSALPPVAHADYGRQPILQSSLRGRTGADVSVDLRQVSRADEERNVFAGAYGHAPSPHPQSLGDPSFESRPQDPDHSSSGVGPYSPVVASSQRPTPLVSLGGLATGYPARYHAPTSPLSPSTPQDGGHFPQRVQAQHNPLRMAAQGPLARPESLRYAVRKRDGTSTRNRPSSAHGTRHWDHHEAGAGMPHLATSTSGKATPHDFPTRHRVPPSPTIKWEEGVEHESTSSASAPLDNPAAAPTGGPQLAALCIPEDMREYFPLDTPEHAQLRVNLLEVMNATWRRSNEKEPDPLRLLQFTVKIEESGVEKYRCLLWSEGVECAKNIPRSDRMLEHLRRHVGVRPFACNCGSDGCPGIFPSKSAMYQHQKNVEPVQCPRCSRMVLRQNLSRHQRSQRCPAQGLLLWRVENGYDAPQTRGPKKLGCRKPYLDDGLHANRDGRPASLGSPDDLSLAFGSGPDEYDWKRETRGGRPALVRSPFAQRAGGLEAIRAT